MGRKNRGQVKRKRAGWAWRKAALVSALLLFDTTQFRDGLDLHEAIEMVYIGDSAHAHPAVSVDGLKI